MNDTVERSLATYISKTCFEDLSHDSISSAKRSLLDVIAAMLAGSGAAGVDIVVKTALKWGGAPEAHLIGFGNAVPAPVAAWCNGTMARALEIDDCVDFLPVHPSASAVPALLALAELKKGLSGRDFITALAVGQDIKIRMGLAVSQNAMESGRNNMFKIFGPAAAVARAMGLGPDETHNALGISFSFAVGDGQCALDGALSLRLQQGIVAQGALLSALLGSQGFTGAKDFLLGRFGYLRAYEPAPRLEFLTKDLGRYFYGEQITIKPFSSCRATHASIELALKLRPRVDLDSVSRIVVHTCPAVYGLVGQPSELKFPDSAPAAQFSIQFTVAAALAGGDFFLKELEPQSLKDAKIIDLARKVVLKSDPSLITNLVLGKTIMEIELKNGSTVSEQIELPLGNPSHPMGYDACAEKFRKCAAYSVHQIGSGNIEEVIEIVNKLEEVPDVSVLASRLY
jgi:2-methylcitrate dehydratase PrpD